MKLSADQPTDTSLSCGLKVFLLGSKLFRQLLGNRLINGFFYQWHQLIQRPPVNFVRQEHYLRLRTSNSCELKST
jgi:hypothetical protein